MSRWASAADMDGGGVTGVTGSRDHDASLRMRAMLPPSISARSSSFAIALRIFMRSRSNQSRATHCPSRSSRAPSRASGATHVRQQRRRGFEIDVLVPFGDDDRFAATFHTAPMCAMIVGTFG